MFTESREADSIDRAIKDHGRARAVERDRMYEGIRLPMASDNPIDKAATCFRPTANSIHVGFETRLIDKDKSFGINGFLALVPCQSLLGDIFAILFCGSRRLFLKLCPRRFTDCHIVFTQQSRPSS